ncbi:rifin [Plasmodium falciparum IGH-CR14]|uniref:Rifin n=1 Tax=Plasmodium falciparum IGH-CR14 TaxID=580059 RepID=A0A0L1I778_PLAFA|nr:rifin [Plasmodium falciparum IGH-CR14]
MKVHYINILLFAVPLNILANTHKKPSISPHHIQTTRLLCECELYTSNYDNDPEMKRVMQQFHDRTTQRFQEYDERLQEKQQICKDKCDKEIQKIILKDKIEKELTEKFSSLHTDIQSDAIPTCICEKSLADKVEKGCLRCGSVLGGGVMPGFGAIGGTALYALNQLKPTAIATAVEEALKAGATKILAAANAAGNAKGMEIVIHGLKYFGVDNLFPRIFNNFVNTSHFAEVTNISSSILKEYGPTCTSLEKGFTPSTSCTKFQLKLGIHLPDGSTLGTPASSAIPKRLGLLLEKATKTANARAAEVSSETSSKILTKQTTLIEAGFNSSTTSIYASIIVILIIVLIMVIIYLILRYRRKKKMKKKLQYIKLLEE